jgi:hypothetical protein
MSWFSWVNTWGSTAEERAASYPCDELIDRSAVIAFRAVSVAAPQELVFRWLCQLRVAPYSYDWIDNIGHQSPRRLIDGLEQLEIGQRFMRIFHLASYEQGSSITLESRTELFGQVAGSYRVTPTETNRSRLVAKLMLVPPPGLWGQVIRHLLPAGDLVMMRRQLLTLKSVAERDAIMVADSDPR